MNLPVSLKTIANGLGIVLLIALVAPFVVYAVPGVVGAEHSFVVLTASMTPAIAPGDVVIVDERDPATIADGDVITFVRGGNEVPVTHRVINVVDGPGGVAFETQGDANGAPDASLVSGENVLGVVMITIPYIGYVIQFTDSPLGFAALVVIPFGLLLLTELWSFARNRRETPSSDDTDVDSPSSAAVAAGTAPAAGDAPGPAEPTGSAAPETDGISVDTVIGAGAVLALFAPYSAYVAFESPTSISLTVAIATTALLLAALATWLPTTGILDRSDPVSTGIDGAGPDVPADSTSADDGSADDGSADDGSPDSTSADDTPTDDRGVPGERPPLATDGAGEDD